MFALHVTFHTILIAIPIPILIPNPISIPILVPAKRPLLVTSEQQKQLRQVQWA